MNRAIKIIKQVFLVLLTFIIVVLFVSVFTHHIQLNDEEPFFQPNGELVEVNKHSMHVYSEGRGENTFVFLSGGGTSSPVFDFKSLYSLLSENNKIVVVEKLGYGFSDIADVDRGIHAILKDTREALFRAGHQPPFILVPHSMSGLEALNWAQLYPNEVKGIIGLDMAVPASYADYDINRPLLQVTKLAADNGITRLIPGIQNSDAIRYGTLTEEEKDLARVVFYRRTATTTMLNEVDEVKRNAEIVGAGKNPNQPILLFSSNGKGTGYDPEKWRDIHNHFIEKVPHGEIILLDVPHYVHNHAYNEIAAEINQFTKNLEN